MFFMLEEVRKVFRVLIIALVLWVGVMPVWAHGGGVLQVASEPAGPYKVSVWTSPSPLANGRPTHITIGIAGGPQNEPILDAAVQVRATSLSTNQTVATTATTEQATNKLFYEADFTLPEQTIYEIQVHVTGRDGEGTVAFEVEVLPQGHTSWWMVGFIGLGIIMSFVLFRVWEGQTAVTNPAKNRLNVDKPSDSSVASE
jgi:hypothetical protein